MSILTSLVKGMSDLVASNIKLRSLRKEDLQRLIRDNIDGHQKAVTILNTFNDSEMRSWMDNQVTPAMKKSSSPIVKIYNRYRAGLTGKSSSLERNRPMSSLSAANASYGALLEEISKKIDKIVERESVDIFNVRMSHLAIFGILKQSNRVLNFTMYMYAFLVRLTAHSAGTIPRYREKYMTDHVESVIRIVGDINDKKGSYHFLQEVDIMRKKHNDMVLGATGSFTDALNMVNIRGFSSSFLDTILGALSHLNVFGAALDAWDDYLLAKHDRNKEIKEWLETHNALLRLDLEQMDKTSPEYIKLSAIIEAYDQKIADYDREINTFEQEG